MSTFVAASRSLSLIPRPLFSNSAPSSDLSVPLPTRVLSVDDLQPIKILGVGSFGTVYLTKDRTTSINLAVKVIPKDDISGQYLDEVIDVLVMEQKVMLALRDSKRALALYASWHDTRYFYLASEYCPNGDLRSEIDRWGVLPPAYARYLAAELLLALEELHSRGMIHRDIKPDNILFDSAGHLRLADFGMARVFSADELAGQAEVKHFPSAYADEDAEVPFGYTNRACGTLDFCAPEILTDSPYTYAPDFWAMGVVVFVMLTGRPPFTALSEEQIISRVLFEPLKFKKSDGIDAAATDFLRKVLRKNPSTRLTVSEMKAHPFFAEIDWIALAEGKVAPPSVPPAHVLRSTGHGLYLPRGAPYTTKEDPYPSYTYTAPILVPSPALTTVSVLRPRKLDVVRHFFSQYLRAHRAATASVRLQDPAEVQVEIEVRVEVREEAHNDGRRGAGPDRENWHDPLPELLLAAPLPPAVPPMWDFSDAPAPDAPKLVPAVLLPRESRSWVDEPALGSETPAAGNGKVKAWLRGMFAKAVAGG
ncbi:kinase-like domain-containing protein [Gloeopeniophorella convolvens]|nr:kinase-like domain-containing protein [Gloeopeniophorella convolvens]